MRKLDYLFMTLIGLILLLILLIHDLFLPIIEFINKYGGLFTLISVIIVLVLFLVEKNLENKKVVIEQHNILRNLKFEIEKIKGDSEGYQTSFFDNNGFPFYPVKELNKAHYLNNINESLVNLKDKKIKDKISTISDKIILLNRYLEYIMHDFNKFLSEKNIKEIKPETTNEFIKNSMIYNFWKSNTKKVKEDMDKNIKEVLDSLEKC